MKPLNKTEEKIYNLLANLYNNYRNLFYDEDYYNYNSAKEKKRVKEKEFVAIPFGSNFIKTLMQIKKTFPSHNNFLDVGCGKGNILGLARSLGFSTEGIEFRKEYSKYLNGFEWHNIRAENYANYNSHDVIFLYYIMKDSKSLSELINNIIEKVKVGTLLYIIGPIPFHKVKKISMDLYQKI